MGDAGRNRYLYTAAGRRWDSASEESNDRNLERIWWCLDLESDGVPGDGLVTGMSAAGIYDRSGSHLGLAWNTYQTIDGPLGPWLVVDHNHNRQRRNDQALQIQDVRRLYGNTPFATFSRVGDYVGERLSTLMQ